VQVGLAFLLEWGQLGASDIWLFAIYIYIYVSRPTCRVNPNPVCVQVGLAFLLEWGQLGASDIWLFARVVEDALDLLLMASRSEVLSYGVCLYEQALVCLSIIESLDASRGRQFHCKRANNCFFFNCVGLIYLAI